MRCRNRLVLSWRKFSPGCYFGEIDEHTTIPLTDTLAILQIQGHIILNIKAEAGRHTITQEPQLKQVLLRFSQ